MIRCPECGTELAEAAELVLYCPNRECPVMDDANLWDGRGNKREEPKIIYPPTLNKVDKFIRGTLTVGGVALFSLIFGTIILKGIDKQSTDTRLRDLCMFSGYTSIKFVADDQQWYCIRNVRGVEEKMLIPSKLYER